MVIAGPGTGKTQILASRIGYILSHPDLGDIKPEQILCLTFTDAGAVAMRQRLLSFIGPEAYRVGVYTFHSFCNKVIQDHPELFGRREMEPISDLEVKLLLRELIDGLDSNSPLKRWGSDRYFEVERMRDLFSTMKKENWSSAFILDAIQRYLEDLPTREENIYKRSGPGYKKGDVKIKEIEKAEKAMAQLREAVGLFDVYEARMKASARYDYEDMIAWVRDAFQDNQDLLLDYQEQFLYLLVDEYQDTNGSQNRIVELLISYWEQPNIFVVGDDDQSIYRFQGASVANITDFTARYRNTGLHMVMLEHNYRSTQNILDAAAQLINNNTDRLVNLLSQWSERPLEKNLRASNSEMAALSEVPKLIAWYNDAHEVVGTALAIEELLRLGVRPSQIAVIYRKHKQAEPILQWLLHKGIAVQTKRSVDLLQSMFSKNLLQILEYVQMESASPGSADGMLYEILHFPYFGLEAMSIATLALDLNELSRKNNKRLSWRQYLQQRKENQPAPTLFDGERKEQELRLHQTNDHLERWIGGHSSLTLQNLFEDFLIRGGVLAWALNQDRRAELLEEINTLFDFIKAETARNPLMSLVQFLDLIRTMREETLPIPLNRSIRSEEGVHFMTAHGSKGLEFDHVFMIGCDEGSWNTRGSNNRFSMPDTLLPGNTGDELQENRRLFYVGITRARRQLQISYAQRDNKGKDRNQHLFFAELQQGAGLNTEEQRLDSEDFVDYWRCYVEPPVLRNLEMGEEERRAYRESLRNFELSVTNLNKYLRCPRSFYYENVLKIPSAKNRFMAFGSAVHYALEFYFKRMMEHPEKQWPSDAELLKWFEGAMNRQRDSFSKQDFLQDSERGERFLPLFVAQHRDQWNKQVEVERMLSKVPFNGVPLKGKLDRMALEGDVVTVCDYKTGKYNFKTKLKFSPPQPDADESESFEKRRGGDYWRQAVFYKILVEHDSKSHRKADSSVFEFVEPSDGQSRFEIIRVPISPQDVELVAGQIQEAWTGIQSLDFERGCQEEWCRWCNFEKARFRELAVENSEEE